MLDALNFVKGAVARKDLVPSLQHFRIERGFIRSFNGTLGLCSPIPCDLTCAPRATQLVQALAAIGEIDVSTHDEPGKRITTQPVALSLNDKGRLLIRSGDFKTFVDTIDPTTFPPYEPQGKRVALGEPILPALRYLEPFIAEDASRQWACGILFDGQSAFATNNIVLQEYWLGSDFPCRVNIPAAAIRELLRIGDEPTHIQMAETRVSFHYEKTRRWLTTNLYEAAWPNAREFLDKPSNQHDFPKGFFDAIERLIPFSDELGRCYFHGGKIATSHEPDATGTTIDLPGIPAAGCFNARQLLRLREVAKTVDFNAYPEPSLFYGGDARGLIVGIKS